MTREGPYAVEVFCEVTNFDGKVRRTRCNLVAVWVEVKMVDAVGVALQSPLEVPRVAVVNPEGGIFTAAD